MVEKGFTVRSLRLPGWNEPIDVKRNTATEDWHQHILSEMTELRQTHETVVVLAHSMGGCLTTVLTQSGQLQPDALVLYAPMFGVSNARSPLLKTRTWFEMGKYILPDSMIMESIFPDHARVIEPRPKTQRDPFVPVSFYKMLYAEMDVWESQPARTSCPVRLVLPGEDRVVDSEKANRWFEALEAPVKIRTVLEKTGHVLPLDLDAWAESDRLFKWLTEQGIAP
jgi:alpha-beta hydrolase superfamily lysophospholipase